MKTTLLLVHVHEIVLINDLLHTCHSEIICIYSMSMCLRKQIKSK